MSMNRGIIDAVDVYKKREETFTCPVCQEIFEAPLALGCQSLHKLCQKCLDKLIEKNGEVKCPLCNESFPRKGCKVDRDFREQLEIFKSEPTPTSTGDNSHPICTCDKYNASYCCNDCCSFICSTCLNFHTNSLTFKDHVVYTIKDLTGKVAAVIATEQKLISHIESNITDLETHQNELRDKCDYSLSALKTHEKRWYEAIEKYFRDRTEEIDTQGAAARSTIERDISHLQEKHKSQTLQLEQLKNRAHEIHQITDPKEFLQATSDLQSYDVQDCNELFDKISVLHHQKELTVDHVLIAFKEQFVALSDLEDDKDQMEMCPDSDLYERKTEHIKDSASESSSGQPDTPEWTSEIEQTVGIASSGLDLESAVASRSELDSEQSLGAIGDPRVTDTLGCAMHREDLLFDHGIPIADGGAAANTYVEARPTQDINTLSHELWQECRPTAVSAFERPVARLCIIEGHLWIIPEPSKGVIKVYDPYTGQYQHEVIVSTLQQRPKLEIRCNVLAATQCVNGDIVVACRGFSAHHSSKNDIGLLEIDADGSVIAAVLFEKIMDVTSSGNNIFALLERGEVRQYRKKNESDWERLRQICLEGKKPPDRIALHEKEIYLSSRYYPTLTCYDIDIDPPEPELSPKIESEEKQPVSLYLCCVNSNGNILVADRFNDEMLIIQPESDWNIICRLKHSFKPLDAGLDKSGNLWMIGSDRSEKHSLYKLHKSHSEKAE